MAEAAVAAEAYLYKAVLVRIDYRKELHLHGTALLFTYAAKCIGTVGDAAVACIGNKVK